MGHLIWSSSSSPSHFWHSEQKRKKKKNRTFLDKRNLEKHAFKEKWWKTWKMNNKLLQTRTICINFVQESIFFSQMTAPLVCSYFRSQIWIVIRNFHPCIIIIISSSVLSHTTQKGKIYELSQVTRAFWSPESGPKRGEQETDSFTKRLRERPSFAPCNHYLCSRSPSCLWHDLEADESEQNRTGQNRFWFLAKEAWINARRENFNFEHFQEHTFRVSTLFHGHLSHPVCPSNNNWTGTRTTSSFALSRDCLSPTRTTKEMFCSFSDRVTFVSEWKFYFFKITATKDRTSSLSRTPVDPKCNQKQSEVPERSDSDQKREGEK